MAVNLTIARTPSNAGATEAIRSPRAMELIKITGAAAAVDDTGTYNVVGFVPDANTIINGGGFDNCGRRPADNSAN